MHLSHNKVKCKYEYVSIFESLFCWREFSRNQNPTVHFPDQWDCVGYTFIPAGLPPGLFTSFLSFLIRLIT